MNRKMEKYFENLSGKKIAVVGIGVSNTPVIKMLLAQGLSVTAFDKREAAELGSVYQELLKLGAEFRLGAGYLNYLDHDVIFRTPGIRPDIPEFMRARERGAVITSEMEAFFEGCPCRIIGVTGSEGKTTTTSIIAELLKAEGKTVYLGGNIGKPLISAAEEMQPTDWAVVELSSFQLMTMKKSPDIAILTNITQNHLDVHKNMDEYIEAKMNIFLHQTPGGRLVLNADNDISMNLKSGSSVTLFSRKKTLNAGFFYDGTSILRAQNTQAEKIIDGIDILLPGGHNIENFMAAFAATEGIVSPQTWRSVARRFKGVSHRLELVGKVDGVSYYNDSKATTPTSAIAGLRAFDQKVILIAGGYDKQIPFDAFGTEIVTRVKTLILTGATAGKIRKSVEAAASYAPGCPEILEFPEFNDAVTAAFRVSRPGDVVLLSPACASFDRFKNFEERGNAFRQIVREIENS